MEHHPQIRRIAALLDLETPVPGVTDLNPHPDIKGLGELAVAAKSKSADLALNARWGYPGQNGVTMPGPGKTTTGTRGEGSSISTPPRPPHRQHSRAAPGSGRPLSREADGN